jgi:hypothetical protein
MVPLGQKMEASIPNMFAAMASSSLMLGSSPKTSSPTAAFIIASFMAGEGRVKVSERSSIFIVLKFQMFKFQREKFQREKFQMFKFQIPNFPPEGDLRGASNSKCSNSKTGARMA